MSNSDTMHKMVELLDVLGKLNKNDLKTLREYLLHEMDSNMDYNNVKKQSTGFLSLADKNKIDIIGGLPYLLNSSDYFKTATAIKDFSERCLHISIPKGNKTKKELIGIIVVGVLELPPNETKRIKETLNEVMDKVAKGEHQDVFLEWEKAISSIEFKR